MKIATGLIFVATFLFSSFAFAQEFPKVTTVRKGDAAPWSGTLMNDVAVAQTIADRKAQENQCALQNKYITDKEGAKCDLLVGGSKINLDYTTKKYESLLELKNQEIARMTKLAEANSKDYSKLWLAGGVLIGVASTIALFFLVNAASK
jgi:hypothetical protein